MIRVQAEDHAEGAYMYISPQYVDAIRVDKLPGKEKYTVFLTTPVEHYAIDGMDFDTVEEAMSQLDVVAESLSYVQARRLVEITSAESLPAEELPAEEPVEEEDEKPLNIRKFL